MALGRIAHLGIALPLVASAADAWGKAQALCGPVAPGKWVRAVVMKAEAAEHPGDADINLFLRPVGPADTHLKAFAHMKDAGKLEDLLDHAWNPATQTPACQTRQAEGWRGFVNNTIVAMNGRGRGHKGWSASCWAHMNGAFCRPVADWNNGLSSACKKLFEHRDCVWDIDKGKADNHGLASFVLKGEVFFGANHNKWSTAFQDAAWTLGLPCWKNGDCKCYENKDKVDALAIDGAYVDGRDSQFICGKEVLIRGLWARDEGHAGRPEIHPISQIVVAWQQPYDHEWKIKAQYHEYVSGFFVDGSVDDDIGDFFAAAGWCDRHPVKCTLMCVGGAFLLGAIPGGAVAAAVGAYGLGTVCANIGNIGEAMGAPNQDADDTWTDHTTDYTHLYQGEPPKISPSMDLRLRDIVPPDIEPPVPGQTIGSRLAYGGMNRYHLVQDGAVPMPTVSYPLGLQVREERSLGVIPEISTIRVDLPVRRDGASVIESFSTQWGRLEFSVGISKVTLKTPRGIISQGVPRQHGDSQDCFLASDGVTKKRWYRFEIEGKTTIPIELDKVTKWTWRLDRKPPLSGFVMIPEVRPTEWVSERHFKYSVWVPVPEEGSGYDERRAGHERRLSVAMQGSGRASAWFAHDAAVLRIPRPRATIEASPVQRRVMAPAVRLVPPPPGPHRPDLPGGLSPIYDPPRLAYVLNLSARAENFCGSRADPNKFLFSTWGSPGTRSVESRGLPRNPVTILQGERRTYSLNVRDWWSLQGDNDEIVLQPPSLALAVGARCVGRVAANSGLPDFGRFLGPPRSPAPAKVPPANMATTMAAIWRALGADKTCETVEVAAIAGETAGVGAEFPRATPEDVRYSWPLEKVKWAPWRSDDLSGGALPSGPWQAVPRAKISRQLTHPNRIRVQTDFKTGLFWLAVTVAATDRYGREAESVLLFNNAPPPSADDPKEAQRQLQELFGLLKGGKRLPDVGGSWKPGSLCDGRFCDPDEEVFLLTAFNLKKTSKPGQIIREVGKFVLDRMAVEQCGQSVRGSYRGPAGGLETAVARECVGKKAAVPWSAPFMGSYLTR